MAGTTLGAISPCFIVTDVNQALAFYCDKLGFQKRFQEPDTDPFFAIVGRDTAQLFVKAEKNVLPQPNHTRHPYMRWTRLFMLKTPMRLRPNSPAAA